jgi:hypothetical protein
LSLLKAALVDIVRFSTCFRSNAQVRQIAALSIVWVAPYVDGFPVGNALLHVCSLIGAPMAKPAS